MVSALDSCLSTLGIRVFSCIRDTYTSWFNQIWKLCMKRFWHAPGYGLSDLGA